MVCAEEYTEDFDDVEDCAGGDHVGWYELSI